MQAQDSTIADHRPMADADSAAATLSRLQLHPHGSTSEAAMHEPPPSPQQRQQQQQQGAQQQHPSAWEELPQGVLIRILRAVSLSDRLCWCALVCRSWSEAAAAATDSIVIATQLSEQQRGRLMMWLRKHSGVVSKVHLCLPRGNSDLLQQLAAVTQLTSLSLTSPPNSLDSDVFQHITPELSALQKLEQLELTDSQSYYGYLPSTCAAALQQLTALTHLKLAGSLGNAPSGPSLQSVWALTQLLSVEIQSSGLRSRTVGELLPDSFQGLSGMTQLTSFTLRAYAVSFTDAANARFMHSGEEPVPGLSRLTQLQVLNLQHYEADGGRPEFGNRLQPSLLSGFKNLQHLTLGFQELVPAATGAQDLLDLLPQLQQLTALQLHEVGDLRHCRPASLTALTASSQLRYLDLNNVSLSVTALTALTASSQLRYLELYNVSLSVMLGWPGDTQALSPWKQAFAPGNHGLSQLQGLSLLRVHPSLTHRDIAHIVRSCPKLDSLAVEIRDAQEEEVLTEEEEGGTETLSSQPEVIPLPTNLTKLHLSLFCPTDDVVSAVAQHLTGLRDLELTYEVSRGEFCAVGSLVDLTGLVQLTRLMFTVPDGINDDDDSPFEWVKVVELLQQDHPSGRSLGVCDQLMQWWREHAAELYHKQEERRWYYRDY